LTTISDAEFAHDLQDLTLPTLCRKYTHEASLHRNMLMSRGTGLAPEWRDFRAFLIAVGRRPSDEHSFILLNRNERTYGPGRARWMTPTNRPSTRKSSTASRPPRAAKPTS
jgi:hypothetical protein